MASWGALESEYGKGARTCLGMHAQTGKWPHCLTTSWGGCRRRRTWTSAHAVYAVVVDPACGARARPGYPPAHSRQRSDQPPRPSVHHLVARAYTRARSSNRQSRPGPCVDMCNVMFKSAWRSLVTQWVATKYLLAPLDGRGCRQTQYLPEPHAAAVRRA
jgi:hypothetical protein